MNTSLLKDTHNIYTCSQGQCNRKFTDKYTFGRHIESQHCDSFEPLCAVSDKVKTINNTPGDYTNSDEMQTDVFDCCIPSPLCDTFNLKNLAAKYIGEAKSMTSSISSAHLMVQSCSNMIECIMTNVLNEIQFLGNMCRSEEEHLQFSNLLTKLNGYLRPFDGLESEYMHKKYMEEQGFYVEPKKYVIGSMCGTELDRNTGI